MTDRIKRFWIREPFCGFSHGLGALLSVAALVALLIIAHGRVWHTITFAIFGASLIVLYTASTLYHSLWVKPQQILKLMRFDHVAIFLLIAGTYAPVCLVGLRGAWGWSLFGVEYGLSAHRHRVQFGMEELPGLGADRDLSDYGLADRPRDDSPCATFSPLPPLPGCLPAASLIASARWSSRQIARTCGRASSVPTTFGISSCWRAAPAISS